MLTWAGYSPGAIDGIFGTRTYNALLAYQRSIREIEITGVADYETWYSLGAVCDPSPVVPPGVVQYAIRQGDTLYKLAIRYNVTVRQILQANPQITNPNNLVIGQIVNIPVF